MGESRAKTGPAPTVELRILEAACLAALIVTPLAFNLRSVPVFEPEKAAVVRVLALLAVAFMGVGWIHRRRATTAPDPAGLEGPAPRRNPLMVLAGLVALVALVSAGFSVDRGLSTAGSFDWRQGAITTLAFVVLFFAAATSSRHPRGAERVLDVMVLACLPVACYALIQAFGADPISWGRAPAQRVTAQAGNPIFLGAHLAMMVPLTLALAVAAGRVGGHRLTSRRWFLGTVTLVLLGALLLTRSRGPILGVAAGGVFVILVALSRLARPRARAAVLLLALVGAGTVAVVVPNGPLASLRSGPLRWTGVEGFSRALEGRSGTATVRVLLWQGMLEAGLATPSRWAFGHGPETQPLVFPPHYRPELASREGEGATADRAHNRTYDALLTRGLLGLLLDLLLVGAALVAALRETGFVSERRHGLALFLVSGLGAILAAGRTWMAGDLALLGPLLPLGALGGMMAYLAVCLVLGHPAAGSGQWTRTQGMVLAAAGAVVAHFVETQVGLEVITTRLYFWAALGVLAGLRLSGSGSPLAGGPDRAWGREWGALAGLAVLATGFGFLTAPGAAAPGPVLALSVLATLAGAWALSGPDRGPAAPFFVAFALVGAVGLGLQAGWSAWVGGSTPAFDPSGPPPLLVTRAAWTWAVLLLPVLALVVGWGARDVKARDRAVPAGALLLALAGAWLLAAGPLRASGLVALARGYERAGDAASAAALYAHASEIQPREPLLLAYLAERTGELAVGSEGAPDRMSRSAVEIMRRAQALRPLDPRFGRAVGRFESQRGRWAATPGEAEAHFARSDAAFEAAVALGPRIPASWTEWGRALLFRGEPEAAIEKLEWSRELNPDFRFTYVPLGNAYGQTGRWADARAAFQRAVERDRRAPASWRGLGLASAQVGDHAAAAEALAEAVRLGARDHVTLGNLGVALLRTGRPAEALPYAEQALSVAPPAARAQLQTLLSGIRAALAGPERPGAN